MKTLWLFVVVFSLWGAVYVPIAAGQAKLVCYFGSWSKYRPDIGMFDVRDIDANLCTHLIFGFSALNETTNEMVAYDAWNELDVNEPGGFYGAYKQFTNLKQKNPTLKVLLAIGGWNEGSEKYSKMAATSATRTKFVNSVVPFLSKYGFDGLDFDWEYPGTRGGDHLVDKENFIALIRQLKQAFNSNGYILTAAVSPGKTNIDIAYNIPALSSILDQIHLMAYDYHGAWEDFTGLNSPLYGNPKYDVGNESTLNVDFSVNYWLEKGADRNKLIVGMPTYGRGFLLDNPSVKGLRAPASLPIDEGPYTRLNGTWSYMEICRKLKDESGWQVCRDNCFQAPYAFRGKQWIGYDDVQSITLKANYARSMNVGGALVWSIDQDDFTGYCNGVTSPLTRKIKEIMNGPMTTKPATCSNIPMSPACQDFITTTSSTTTSITTTPRPTTTTTTPSTTPSTTTRPTTPSTTAPTASFTTSATKSIPTTTRSSTTRTYTTRPNKTTSTTCTCTTTTISTTSKPTVPTTRPSTTTSTTARPTTPFANFTTTFTTTTKKSTPTTTRSSTTTHTAKPTKTTSKTTTTKTSTTPKSTVTTTTPSTTSTTSTTLSTPSTTPSTTSTAPSTTSITPSTTSTRNKTHSARPTKTTSKTTTTKTSTTPKSTVTTTTPSTTSTSTTTRLTTPSTTSTTPSTTSTTKSTPISTHPSTTKTHSARPTKTTSKTATTKTSTTQRSMVTTTTPSTTTSTTTRLATQATTSTTPSTTSTTKSTPTSTPPSTTASKGTTPVSMVCDGSPERYVFGCIDDPQNSKCEKATYSLLPHPTDSTRFLYCVKNYPLFPNAWVIYMSRCPSRLLFNTYCNVCAFTMLAQEC